ncbi:MAG: response regulator, partial [Nocardioides sp.]
MTRREGPDVVSAQRVLVVDDHPVVRRGLRVTLESEPWVTEVREATTAAEAVREAVAARPDLIVMDLRLPDDSGIEATRRILKAVPEAVVLVLTMDADEADVAAALKAGARGFLLKDLDADDLVSALRAVACGSLVLGAEAGRMLTAQTSPAGRTLPEPLDRLTERELEMLTMLANSQSTAGIARALGVSEKTIRNQFTGLFGKLGVADRVQAALLAQRLGLTT